MSQEKWDEYHEMQRQRDEENRHRKAAAAKRREEREDEAAVRTCVAEDVGDECDWDVRDEDESGEESDGNETERPRQW